MHKSLNILLLVTAVAVTLLSTWLMDGQRNVQPVRQPDESDQTAPGEPAPDITLVDLNGKSVRLSDYKGKIVLLNFWATWCAPCIAEFPQFIALAKAMPDIAILTVSIDDKKENIPKFLKRYVPDHAQVKNVEIFWDGNKAVSQDLFQTVRVPETIVISPDMMMVRKVAGLDLKWDSPETIDYFRSLKK